MTTSNCYTLFTLLTLYLVPLVPCVDMYNLLVSFSLFVCLNVSPCVCLCVSVPSTPEDPVYVNSTESSMTLSWRQSGAVDSYVIKCNNVKMTSVILTGVGKVSVSATVGNLSTSGTYYCISVTAVSGQLHSDNVTLCNYTGVLPIRYLLLKFVKLLVLLYSWMFTCLSVYVCVSLSLCLDCLSVCMSWLFVCLSDCLWDCLLDCLSICLSFCHIVLSEQMKLVLSYMPLLVAYKQINVINKWLHCATFWTDFGKDASVKKVQEALIWKNMIIRLPYGRSM